MWQQLELASELKYDLQDTVDWGRRRFVNFKAEKTQLVLFYWSNNTVAIDVKMDRSVLEEKSSFKVLGCLSVLNWIGPPASLLLKEPGAFIHSMKFLSCEVALYL